MTQRACLVLFCSQVVYSAWFIPKIGLVPKISTNKAEKLIKDVFPKLYTIEADGELRYTDMKFQ